MPSQTTPLFTPAEAAVLSGLPLKAVQALIDTRGVDSVRERRGGQDMVLLDLRGVLALVLERRLADRLTPGARLEVFASLSRWMREAVVLDEGALTIDLRAPRRALVAALLAWRRARRLVASDPGIMGGEPVFRGSRIPVHMVAGLVAEGFDETAVMEGYPSLTVEMVRMAPLYAAAYPLPARARRQPWRGQKPLQTTRRRLMSLAGP
jgi:uncharacterized protein (DUF433 family)